MKSAISTDQTSSNIDTVLSILTQTPSRLQSLSAPLSPEQFRKPLGPNERSFTEVLAHLINFEENSSQAIYLALLTNVPYFADVHPERKWGKLLRHDLSDFADLLFYFKYRRQVLMRVLNSLTEKQWARAIREEGKQRKESVYLLCRSMVMHELDHLSDLERSFLIIGGKT